MARPARPRATRKLSTRALQTLFVEAYAANGSIADTCRQIRLERRRVYDWLEADPEFGTALKDAEVEALERLRGAAHKRALTRSDAMLMFLLKRLQPEVFGDKPKPPPYLPPPGTTVTTTVRVERWSNDDLATMKRLLEKAGVNAVPMTPIAALEGETV